jgi:hypothetical protein
MLARYGHPSRHTPAAVSIEISEIFAMERIPAFGDPSQAKKYGRARLRRAVTGSIWGSTESHPTISRFVSFVSFVVEFGLSWPGPWRPCVILFGEGVLAAAADLLVDRAGGAAFWQESERAAWQICRQNE